MLACITCIADAFLAPSLGVTCAGAIVAENGS